MLMARAWSLTKRVDGVGRRKNDIDGESVSMVNACRKCVDAEKASKEKAY